MAWIDVSIASLLLVDPLDNIVITDKQSVLKV
jgi:hypothetical protein